MKNRIFITALLSFIFPGVGHIYCGRLLKGFVIFILIFFLFLSVLVRQFALFNLYTILGFDILAIVLWGYAIIDSIVIAKKDSIERQKSYIKWCFILPLFLGLYIIMLNYTNLPSRLIISKYKLCSGFGTSMYPTFLENDKVVVEFDNFKITDFKRGDIINFEIKDIMSFPDTLMSLQKRIIGLPGEKLEVIKGEVYIDGEKIDEPWLYLDEEIYSYIDDTSKYIYSGIYRLEISGGDTVIERDTVIVLHIDDYFYTISKPPVVINNNCVYVLGDNRLGSSDSRRYGTIPLNRIIGKAKYIYRPYWRARKL